MFFLFGHDSNSLPNITRAPLSEVLAEEPPVKPVKEPEIMTSLPEAKEPVVMPKEVVGGREPSHEVPKKEVVKPSTSNVEQRPSSSPGLFTVGIIIFSLIFGLAGWILYFNTKFNFIAIPTIPQPEEIPQETPSPGAPTPTVAPVNHRQNITLEILNGSGVKGAAGTTADKLTKLGYTILSTGNADKQNYTTTQILTSAKFVTSELLLSDLTKEYNSASISGTLKDSTASARIIIGKDWTR